MTNWMMGDRFDTVYPHKGSIKALWETKWKFCVSLPLPYLYRYLYSANLAWHLVPEIHLSFPRWII